MTKHKLIHDGFLTWHINQSRNKTIDVHVVLLEDLLVFLQKQDDRLVLKCHDTTMVQGAEPQKYTHSPILKIGNVLTRNVATSKLNLVLNIICTHENICSFRWLDTKSCDFFFYYCNKYLYWYRNRHNALFFKAFKRGFFNHFFLLTPPFLCNFLSKILNKNFSKNT